ncbi:MAG TPA: Na+/H+ antiporter NhaA [Actinomycetota bacterium]|nr:Na+/H+ antiporter NhaA [Actinomycetota bacterium]
MGIRRRRTGRSEGAAATFLRTESGAGVVLLAATLTALLWANGPAMLPESYEFVWRLPLHAGPLQFDLRHWINDGLMTLFFFVVGLEVKRELVTGELRDPRTAALPVLAALGGMVGPALVYLAIVGTGPDGRGWGIPMATDIAFAVGVLSLLGKRVPVGAKVFLLTLAVADDIGAIMVIAFFYSSGLSGPWLGISVAAVVMSALAYRLAGGRELVLVPLSLLSWFAMYKSGVHPTIAGVALGLLTPAGPGTSLEKLEHGLHPWTSRLILPLFALANAGVMLRGGGLRLGLGSRVLWGVALGLVLGKMLGITLIALAGVRLRVGRLPQGVTPGVLLALSAVAGIGLTVSLFITELAFEGSRAAAAAKLGVLAGSSVAAVVGALLMLTCCRKAGRDRPRARSALE